MDRLLQFVKFGIVATVNILSTYIIYIVMLQTTRPAEAMAIAYGLPTMVVLLFNSSWLFDHHQVGFKMICKYYLTYLCSWAFCVGNARFLGHFAFVNRMLIPLFCLAVVLPVVYLLCRNWVFSGAIKARR